MKFSKLFLSLVLTVVMISGCTQNAENSNNKGDKLYTAGTYTGAAEGHNGPVKVKVTFSDSKITNVEVSEQNETAEIAENAIKKIPSQIVDHQSLAVDAVAGASQVSSAILTAVEDAVKQAGGNVEKLKANKIEKNGTDEKITTKIVIVGGGASGTAAALKAIEFNSDVIVVETTPSPMGQGTMAGGMFATNSSQQIEQHKTVDPKWYYEQYVTTGNYMVNMGLLSKVINNSGHIVDWLEQNGGKFTLAHPGTGSYYEHRLTHPNSTLHGYTEGGAKTITDLHQTIKQKGGKILYNTKATDIITDNGKVVGIKAEKEDGGTLTIKADKVILATGGFGGNEKLVKETFGDGYGQSRVATNIGTGIAMAKEAGGDADYSKAIMMHYGVSRGGTNWGTVLNSALLNPYLHVDVDGNRFMNEEEFIFEPIKSSNVIKSLPQHTAYEIFDQTMIDVVKQKGFAGITDIYNGDLAEKPTKFVEVGHEIDTAKNYKLSHTPTDLTKEIDQLVSEGKIIKAASVDELAQKLNMSNLANTVTRYNELCVAGKDSDHFKSSKYLDNVEGTVYAVKITSSVFLGTLGGITVNDNLQVLNKEGKPVDGLYAVGAETSGIYNGSYVYFEGGTLGYAYGSGYIAGEHAAKALWDGK